jgi:hypothetical protein
MGEGEWPKWLRKARPKPLSDSKPASAALSGERTVAVAQLLGGALAAEPAHMLGHALVHHALEQAMKVVGETQASAARSAR